jgi:outer membrane protein
MTFKPFAAGFCAVAALSAASGAFAQAATPAAPPLAHGPPLPGVCVIDMDQIVVGSTVGRYVQQRLQQIQAQANAEVNGDNTQLNNDAKALDAQRATLDQTTFEQRATAIQVRNNALQRKVQQRERELQMTEQKALSRVVQEAEQPIRAAYQQKGCSALMPRNATLSVYINTAFYNPAMDMTPQVVAALNAKVTQFAFDRERLDQPSPTTAAGAAPPIVQTPAPAPRPAVAAPKK